MLCFSETRTKKGNPLAVVVLKKNKPTEFTHEQFARSAVVSLQRVADRADEVPSSEGKMVSIYDFRDITSANLDIGHSKVMF